MRTLEQRRAKFALGRVESVVEDPESGKYKTWLIKLPGLLHNNGLGRTVAFYLTKNTPRRTIVRWLGDWLKGKDGAYSGDDDLLHLVSEESEELYRKASMEARALALWLKRFAEAFLEGSDE